MFYVCEIEGPACAESVALQLGYSSDKTREFARLRPAHFPIWISSDRNARCWFASGFPNHVGGTSSKVLHWQSYLEALNVPIAEVARCALSDLSWMRGRFKDLRTKMLEFAGEGDVRGC